MKKVTAREAKQINERLGLSWDDGQTTFWAYDEDHDEIYDFDSKKERDEFVERINAKKEKAFSNIKVNGKEFDNMFDALTAMTNAWFGNEEA